MKKRCANCKFLETDPNFEPCHSCTPNFLIGGEWTRPNFQPARPKRKELEARVAELEARLADWKRWHQFRDEELQVANAELESMHRELAAAIQQAADRQAIIAELERELEAAKRTHTYTYVLPTPELSKFPQTIRCVKCGQFINWQFDASDHTCPESNTA